VLALGQCLFQLLLEQEGDQLLQRLQEQHIPELSVIASIASHKGLIICLLPQTEGQPPRLALPAKEDDGPEKAGVRKSRFALAEGDVVVTFPENLSADSVEDLDGFWQVFVKKARREAAK
jgi:hypothetical protein